MMVRESPNSEERIFSLRFRQAPHRTISVWENETTALKKIGRVPSLTLVKDKLLLPVRTLFQFRLIFLVQPEAFQVKTIHFSPCEATVCLLRITNDRFSSDVKRCVNYDSAFGQLFEFTYDFVEKRVCLRMNSLDSSRIIIVSHSRNVTTLLTYDRQKITVFRNITDPW